MKLLQGLAYVFCIFVLTGPAEAQNEIRIDPPNGGRLGWLTHSYQTRDVPPINVSNSSRLESLIRAGNLYLSAQDAVALALENNIDIEVQRYGPLMARELLRRAEGGGALRSVGVGVAQGPQSVSLQGVTAGGTLLGGSVGTAAGVFTQSGPAPPAFDPAVTVSGIFQHESSPQSNTFLIGTSALVSNTETFQVQYSQSWDFGLTAQATYANTHTSVNSQVFDLNPSTSGSVELQLTQNLLLGFGAAVNNRNIRIQKNNLKVTDLQFKQQVSVIVAAVLNLYWDLVSFHEDVRARQQEVEAAQLLLDDNQKLAKIGALPAIEVTRAESQVYAGQQDLLVSQTNLLQQELVLKNALSRQGPAGPELAGVHVIPLDTIAPPDDDTPPSIDQLVQEALDKRVEIAQSRLNLESNRLNLIGVRNALKPSLQAFAELSSNGLTGSITAFGAAQSGVNSLAGGLGALWAQMALWKYPTFAVGFTLNLPIHNRAAQSDYATSVLELRQNELNLQKNINQIQVDVESAVIGLQQARARYNAAVKAQVLQQEALKSDQRKNFLGAGTIYQVVQDQRDLASTDSAVTQAMANYTHARIALDEALGRTLETNNISIEEARSAKVSRSSMLPASLPTGDKR